MRIEHEQEECHLDRVDRDGLNEEVTIDPSPDWVIQVIRGRGCGWDWNGDPGLGETVGAGAAVGETRFGGQAANTGCLLAGSPSVGLMGSIYQVSSVT